MIGARREPEREINREVRIDSLRLHLLDDGDGALDRGRVQFAVLVKNGAVTADEVHAVLGEHNAPSGAGRRGHSSSPRRPVHRPEAHWLTVGAVDESGRPSPQ